MRGVGTQEDETWESEAKAFAVMYIVPGHLGEERALSSVVVSSHSSVRAPFIKTSLL